MRLPLEILPFHVSVINIFSHLVEVVSRDSDLYMMNTIKLNNEAKVSG